jgi:hypothetical protein
LCWNGIVADINTTLIAPEINPNLRIVLFMSVSWE